MARIGTAARTGAELSTGGDLDQYLSEIRWLLMKHRPAGHSPRFLVIDLDGSTEVLTVAPYDFTGNYVVIPLFEPAPSWAGRRLSLATTTASSTHGGLMLAPSARPP